MGTCICLPPSRLVGGGSRLYLIDVAWLMYIDDVLMVWAGTRSEQVDFMGELGNNTRNLRLTFVVDPHEILFLDLSIKLVNIRLTTKTFRKETAANTLLQADSHHPRSLIQGIQRNCSTEEDYRNESEQLYRRFRERGYSHPALKRAKKIAGQKSTVNLLQPCEKTQKQTDALMRLITPYGTHWHQVNSILSNHWHILTRSDGLKDH